MKLAIISDIHEDIVSLRLAIARIEKEQCDEIICLGDISGFSEPYYPYRQTRNAHECLAVIRANCKIIIAGNHDLNASRIIPENSPLFNYPEDWYDMDYFEKMEVSQGKLWMYDENELNPLYSKSDIEFISLLPEYEILTFGEKNIFFSHYLYPNITGSIKAMSHAHEVVAPHLELVREKGCDIAFAGHEHNRKGIIYAENGVRFFGKRIKMSPVDLSCVLIPAIASGPNRNGFCIFDLNSWSLKIKRL